MLNNKNRLRDKRDFSQIMTNGISVANRNFVLYSLKKSEQENFRVGFSVSKKIGNAVTRNKVKRLLREAVRLESSRIPNELDLVIIARVPSSELNFHEVRENVIHLFGLMAKGKKMQNKKDRAKK